LNCLGTSKFICIIRTTSKINILIMILTI